MTDEQFDAARERSRRSKARARHRELLARAKTRANPIPSRAVAGASPRLVQQVRHHLAKGRDVGDIAVRENVPASIVQQVVAWIRDNP